MVAIILSVIAIVMSGVGIGISISRRRVAKEVTTLIKYAPVEHPFTYDDEKKSYVLDGNLETTGSIACLKKKEVENGI